MRRIGFILLCLAPLMLAGCATPVLKKDEVVQIVDVKVTKANPRMGTANFAEAIRYKTLNAAYRFSEQGTEATLDVQVTGLETANAVKAFLIGGNSSISAKVALTEKATGKQWEPVDVYAIIPRFGGVLGALQSAGVNPIEEEQTLTSKLAEQIMKRIYGEEWANRVASRTPSKRAVANYPMSYAEASKKFECDAIRSQIEADEIVAKERGNQVDLPSSTLTLPSDC